MKWRPHTGQRHSSIPDASVPSWTISWGGGARIGGSFLVRSWVWCTQDSHAPTPAGHTRRNGLLCAKEVTWKFWLTMRTL